MIIDSRYMAAMRAKKAKELDAKPGAPAGPGKGPGGAKPVVKHQSAGGYKGTSCFLYVYL